MSWFSRLREYLEEEDILADDFEAEFDAIADALNSLVVTGRTAASEDKIVISGEAWVKANHRISSTAEAISLVRASIVKIWATFDFDLLLVNGEEMSQEGTVAVDDAAQTAIAVNRFTNNTAGNKRQRKTVSQTYEIELAAGSHTLELWARLSSSTGGESKARKTNTSLSYMILPDPEP